MQRFEHSVAYKLRYPAQSKITTCEPAGFLRSRERVGGASKMKANARLYLILQRRADGARPPSRRRRDDST